VVGFSGGDVNVADTFPTVTETLDSLKIGIDLEVVADNTSGGKVLEGESAITSITTVIATARPILESAAAIRSSTTVIALGAVTTESGVEPILSVTTVSASGRLKWEPIVDPTSPTWTEIPNPTDTWTPI
jgi:hypothetical protein